MGITACYEPVAVLILFLSALSVVYASCPKLQACLSNLTPPSHLGKSDPRSINTAVAASFTLLTTRRLLEEGALSQSAGATKSVEFQLSCARPTVSSHTESES